MTNMDPRTVRHLRDARDVIDLALRDSELGWDLGTLQLVAEAVTDLGWAAQALADALRSNGATWADIGDAMGISRQGAQKRFR